MGHDSCGSAVPTVPLPLLVHSQPISLTPEGRCQRPLIVRPISVQFYCSSVLLSSSTLSNPIPFQRKSAYATRTVAHDR